MTAKMMGALTPRVNRFQVGDLEVASVLDGTVQPDAIKPPLCLNMSDDEIAALAQANHIPSTTYEHPFAPTLVNTGNELVLFDVGFGGRGPTEDVGLLRSRMAEAGYTPEDVDLVVFSHCHGDHILGVSIDDKPAFPNARYAISQVEFDTWSSGEGLPESRAQNRQAFLNLIAPLGEQMTFLQPGDTVASGITAIEAYGHSPGHMVFMVEDGDDQVMLMNDLVVHYVFSLQVPEARVFFDDNPELATATRKRILDMVATDGTPVIGYHMPFPSLGYIDRHGDGYRWVPASYQMRV